MYCRFMDEIYDGVSILTDVYIIGDGVPISTESDGEWYLYLYEVSFLITYIWGGVPISTIHTPL